jgi:adenylate cyclase
MAGSKDRTIQKWLDPKYFSFVLGLAVFLVIWLFSSVTDVFSRLETDVLDLHFQLKFRKEREIVESGVIEETQNLRISNDIVILGIDSSTLDTFGRWPFSRDIHAGLINSFSRISNQETRESSLFLDIFFNEPYVDPTKDELLVQSIKENGRVFLENILDINPPSYARKDTPQRMEALYNAAGRLTNIKGDVSSLITYYSTEAPLVMYGESVKGYGHANFGDDWDKIYRRQQLVARYSNTLGSIRLDQLDPSQEMVMGERLAWQTRDGKWIDVPSKLNQTVIDKLREEMNNRAPSRSEDTDEDGKPDNKYFELVRYKDEFIPSVTLSLAANYFNTPLEEIEIVVGDYILFSHPQVYNPDTNQLEPYRIMTEYAQFDEEGNITREAQYRTVPEVRIPIDEKGQMLINFMGARSNPGRSGYQTYTVRSYSAYARRVPPEDPSRWPKTKAVANKILMVGGFFQGTDEKTTPFGLMYGVEVHANALNTIIMDNFLHPLPGSINLLILLFFILFIAFYSSRINTLLSFLITGLLVAVYFYVGQCFLF